MKIVRRYFAREIYGATTFVFIAFLALFAFFDLINELGDIGKGAYRLGHALMFVALSVPVHVYELFPIAVLIGTVYALARLAGNSEYTALRASGMSPAGTAGILLRLGVALVALTFVFGEFIAPASDKAARQLKLQATSAVIAQEFRTGLWVRDESRFVNVREVLPDTSIAGIRIYEFDSENRLVSIADAARGVFSEDGVWNLENVIDTKFGTGGVNVERVARVQWRSVLTPDILTVLYVQPDRMSAWNLYQYVKHLSENRQRTERYEIALWKKIVYPFAALVMMGLALPFAYLHVRSGGVGGKVFAGIMIGILFHMLNSLFSHIGLLQGWTAVYSAVAPSALFLVSAAVMMWWVERR